MLFPEELDNRSFRLLVERTLTRRRDKQTLSNMEQDINELITMFPELGFHTDETIDIHAQFGENENNPFLVLSALWEVFKQIRTDAPRGIKKIINDYFRTTQLKSDDLYLVAEIYLMLYQQQVENGALFSEKEYLWEMYYSLNQTDENPKSTNAKKSENDSVPPGLISDVFSTIARELHDEASFFKLDPDANAADIYAELPIEWINAMSNFWQRPEHNLKRDNIQELVSFFTSPEFQQQLPSVLSREEKSCLTFIINKNNRVTYSEASKEFGPEHNDGYWWTQDVPKSTLGNLRMKGLIVVGEVMFDSAQRMAIIPNEIYQIIKKVKF